MRRPAAIGAGVVLLLVGVVTAVVLWRNAAAPPPYPDTPAGWIQRWSAAAAEFGRTPGEGWDAWLDADADLKDVTDRAAVAARIDELQGIPRFTPPAPPPEAVGIPAAFDTVIGPTRRVRPLVLEHARPAIESAMASGDFDAAADWVGRAWTLARVVGGSGTIIGGLTQNAVAESVLATARPHLPALAAAGHDRLERLLAEAPLPDPVWTLRLERELALAEMHALRADSLLIASDELAVFESALADWAAWETHGDAEARDRVLALQDRLRNDTIYAARRPMLDMFLPALDRASAVLRTTRAHRAAVPVLIALEHHHAEHGGYPDTLDALVPARLPAVPPDPFTPEGPLRYEPADDGAAFRLTAAGPDAAHGTGDDVVLDFRADAPATPARPEAAPTTPEEPAP